MFDNQFINALILTLAAGLSTLIGSALAFRKKKLSFKGLSFILGFSAGVMTYVSFMDLLPEAFKLISEEVLNGNAKWLTIIFFFVGIAISAIIDKVIPCYENPHDIGNFCNSDRENKNKTQQCKKLLRLGIFSALAIAIHNFPEGMITFTTSMKEIGLGMSMAIAIALHNIPEGIAISMPIFYATKSRKKAFLITAISGLAEPVGGVLGYLIFSSIMNGLFMGGLLAFVAGIMIFISLDELLPNSIKCGTGHSSIYGVLLGMLIMAISLNLF